jgi:rod shape-determining protein MreC
MEYGPPPLFNQGVSARARLAIFALCASVLIIIDAQVNVLDPIRNGVAVLLFPVQRVLLWPRDAMTSVAGYFVSKSSLASDNERLRQQLAQQSLQLREAEQAMREDAQLRVFAGMRERFAVPTMAAHILYESRDPFSHRVVVDRGTADGLRSGSPVVDEAGVVGQVTRVFPRSSEVTLVTDKDQSLPVQIVRNGLHAVAFGSSEAGSLELRFLPANVDVGNGDAVVTSGLDGVYPAGLPVATVQKVVHDVKDQFARVILKPVAGVSTSTNLLVLNVEPPALIPEPDEGRGAGAGRVHPRVERR